MTEIDIDEIDKSLEIVALIRASEAGYARDYRRGHAFGPEGDKLRLDAFTLGLIDALAHRIGSRNDTLRILTYLHNLMEQGPGRAARSAFREMCAFGSEPKLARYVAGGRHHVVRFLAGNPSRVGRFARLLSEELGDS